MNEHQQELPNTPEECEDLAIKCHEAGVNLHMQASRQFMMAGDLSKRAGELYNNSLQNALNGAIEGQKPENN